MAVCVYRERITVMRALCQQLLPSPFSLLITAPLDSLEHTHTHTLCNLAAQHFHFFFGF